MEHQEEILRLTRDLVSINTCSSPMNSVGVKEALDVVSKELGDRGRSFEKNGVHSRLWTGGENLLEPKLLLCGHIDVVKASEYKMSVDADKDLLKGRGVADMKGHVAVMVSVFNRLRNDGLGDEVALLLTGDEEVGGFNGTRYIIDEFELKPELVFVPDGDWNFDLCISQKAPHHMLFKASTSGGHAAKAFELVNPDRLVTKTIEKIQKKLSKATKEQPWESTFEVTVRHTFVSEPELGKTGVENSVNSIPGFAEAQVSWRFPVEKYDFAKTRKWIGRVAKSNGVEVVDLHGGGEGCLMDMKDERVLLWKEVIKSVLGQEVGIVNAHGASDARHFFRNSKTRLLLTSANCGEVHNDKEWVSLKSLVNLAEALYLFAKRLLK